MREPARRCAPREREQEDDYVGSCISCSAVWVLLLAEFGAAQTEEVGTLRGQLWLVSNANLSATRPVPQAAPDATFVTRHVSFAMTPPCCGSVLKNVNNTVEGFLGSAHPDAVPPVKDLAFSGLYNSVVGAVVDANTSVGNSTAGSYSTYGNTCGLRGEFSSLTDSKIVIAHDCGVSLWIDDVRIPGFTEGCDSSFLQGYQFPGLTGAHKIELLYVNRNGPGSLSFSPKM